METDLEIVDKIINCVLKVKFLAVGWEIDAGS